MRASISWLLTAGVTAVKAPAIAHFQHLGLIDGVLLLQCGTYKYRALGKVCSKQALKLCNRFTGRLLVGSHNLPVGCEEVYFRHEILKAEKFLNVAGCWAFAKLDSESRNEDKSCNDRVEP